MEKNQLCDKIEYHQKLFISKIAQDISFILSLSLDNKDKIKNLIEKDLKKNMNEFNKNTTKLFLNNQTITDELSKILNKFMQILKENDKNNVIEKLNEKEDISEFNDELISINGIQAIFNDNLFKNEINEDNNYKDTFLDMLNNLLNHISNHEINIEKNDNNDKIKNSLSDKSENKSDNKSNASSIFKQDIKSDNKNNEYDNENAFEISLLIEDIKEEIKNSIFLINLKLYYQFFCRNINKIFINNVSRLLSINIIGKNNNWF